MQRAAANRESSHRRSRCAIQGRTNRLLIPFNSEAAAAKKEEAAAKKAEKALLLAAEEASLPSKAKGSAKAAPKKSRGLDLAALDGYIPDKKGKSTFGPPPPANNKASAISASGIENALDALDITGSSADAGQVDRHPERRFKAAYTAFEERRLDEMKDEKGLRRNQKIEQIRKEFEKHPDNPFNQVAGKYNSTRGELREIADQERTKTEARLTGQQGS